MRYMPLTRRHRREFTDLTIEEGGMWSAWNVGRGGNAEAEAAPTPDDDDDDIDGRREEGP